MDHDRQATNLPCSMFLTLFLAAAIVLAVGFYLGRQMLGLGFASPIDEQTPVSADTGDSEKPVTELPANLFKDWGTPDVALVVSGQSFGYLQPCGCSSPQYGGLVRRYNVVKMLEKKGWKVAGIDVGEIYPPKVDLPEQAREKFKTILRAMDVMNYQDFGLGVTEMKMPLVTGLAEMLPLNIKQPRPVSLDLKDPNKVFESLSVRSYDLIGGPAKIGVTSLAGPSLEKAMAGDANIQFFPNAAMIPVVLSRFAKEKADVVVLMVSSTTVKAPGQPETHPGEKEAEDIARLCHAEREKNPALPNVDLIIHTSELDTPPSRPQLVPGTNTRLLIMGHKAKYIGVLGLFRKQPSGFELKYELVSLSPQFETPEGQEVGHPVMKLMEEYAETVKARDFLGASRVLRGQHPTQRSPILAEAEVSAKYVGSERCGDCHAEAYQIWQKTGHSHAFQTLEDVQNPKLRQFDPECVVCHTVGFKYDTGYYDPPAGATAKQIEKHNLRLRDVGCESCHGPGSMHADNPGNPKYLALINPIKLKGNPNNALKLDFFCQTCHDIENDVHWGQKKPFQQSWDRIAHPTPKKAE